MVRSARVNGRLSNSLVGEELLDTTLSSFYSTSDQHVSKADELIRIGPVKLHRSWRCNGDAYLPHLDPFAVEYVLVMYR